ncbi:MAG: hypothetical protein ACE5NM_01995 [Sedimentisphaerales bacterium]
MEVLKNAIFKTKRKVPLVEMDISYCWISITDMVPYSGSAKALTGDVSMSAGSFSVSFGICGMAFKPGWFSNCISKGKAQLCAEAVYGGFNLHRPQHGGFVAGYHYYKRRIGDSGTTNRE